MGVIEPDTVIRMVYGDVLLILIKKNFMIKTYYNTHTHTHTELSVVVLTFNSSTQEAEAEVGGFL